MDINWQSIDILEEARRRAQIPDWRYPPIRFEFCRNFITGKCYSYCCKYIHGTREDPEAYAAGRFPPPLRIRIQMEAIHLLGTMPVNFKCIDWLNTSCFRRDCCQGLHPVISLADEPPITFLVDLDPFIRNFLLLSQRSNRTIICHPRTPVRVVEMFCVKAVLNSLENPIHPPDLVLRPILSSVPLNQWSIVGDFERARGSEYPRKAFCLILNR